MKKLIYIILFLPLQILATNYYVKNGGSDAAAGTSDETAWATVAKVNSCDLQPGDSVKFKCGGIWRELGVYIYPPSGAYNNHIVYTSYGEGEKPLFVNAKNESLESDWVNVGTNLWRNTDNSFSTEVGNLIFNGGTSIGWRVFSAELVNTQGRFFYDSANRWVLLYSVGNPAVYYSDIECALKIVSSVHVQQNRGYITIDGLAFRNNADGAVLTSSGSHNVIIRNCDMEMLGGRVAYSTTRLGNAITFWGNINNALVENNYINNMLDAGVSPQHQDKLGMVVNNVRIRNNIIANCDMGFEFWYMNCSGVVDSVIVEHNTFFNSGRGVFHAQKTSNVHQEDYYIAWLHQMTVSNIIIRNNINYNSLGYVIRGALVPQSLIYSLIDWDYNVHNSSFVARLGDTYYNFLNWQTYSNEDANSISDDPLLNSDYTLQSKSPAIGIGVNIPETLYDYLGNEWKTPRSVGAIERYDEYPPVEPVIVTTIRPYWTSESTAVAGGSVTSTGGGTVSVRGVCWNTTGIPTTSDSKTEDGSGTGSFVSLMTGLDNTLNYYIRAYAENESGTSYGNQVRFGSATLLIDQETGKPLVKDGNFLVSDVPTYYNIWYVSPDGDNDNPGSITQPWKTWGRAFNATEVEPGDIVYFRGGTYRKDIVNEPTTYFYAGGAPGAWGYRITVEGTEDNKVHFFAYPGEEPVLDQDDFIPTTAANYGIRSDAFNVHFKGLTIRNVFQPGVDSIATGWRMGGENVTIEQCKVHNIGGSGFSTAGINMRYINCDVWNICDTLRSEGLAGQTGNGFGSTSAYSTESVYYFGCRAWNCADQGFTLGLGLGYVEVDSCWSFLNGALDAGGHGWKMGWAKTGQVLNPRIYVHNCMAAYNREYGFSTNDLNLLPNAMHIYNNTSYKNGTYGFVVSNTSEDDETELKRVFRNNIAYDNVSMDANINVNAAYTHSNNTWDIPLTLTDDDFASVDSAGILGARGVNGELPVINFLNLSTGSQALDAGADVGIDFTGTAPDLGAFEKKD